MNEVSTAEALRAWARGYYSQEAAVELLLRAFGGRFARPGWCWVLPDDDEPGGWWVEPEQLYVGMGVLSGGEQRILTVVVGLLGCTDTVSLSELVTGLDRDNVALVLAALAHAAGTHQHSDVTVQPDGSCSLEPLGSLYPWPASEAVAR